MERLDLSLLTNRVLRFEHMARYSIAYDMVRGVVKDCACGIGYGSSFISKNSNVSRVSASDVSKEAIDYALKQYSSEKLSFSVDDIRNNNSGEVALYDSFVCFETLEHLKDPDVALDSISKVLKPDGLFLGTVPSRFYDEACEKNFGKNEYHVTRFDFQTIKELLANRFEFVRVFANELRFDSHLYDFESTVANVINYSSSGISKDNIFGSFFFVASNNKKRFDEAMSVTGDHLIIKGLNYIELFNELHLPVREAFLNTEKLVVERNEYIAKLEEEVERLKNSDARYQLIEESLSSYKAAYENEHKLLIERIEYIKVLEGKLNGR